MFPEIDRGSVTRRFEDKFIPEPNSGCWLWLGATGGKKGYGKMMLRHTRRPEFAHRISFYLSFGQITKHVLHKCDNPYCVNPEHLFEGTNDDNIADMVAKNRNRRGERHHWSVLTEEDVGEIRKLIGFQTLKSIADMYGVSKHAIWAIKEGKNWSKQ